MRFFAAISVITVCCYASVVQAQAKPPAERPMAPVSSAQADDSAPRTPVDIRNLGVNAAELPLPPELEKLLRDWAAASERIQRLEGKHVRRVYDTEYEIEKLSQGRFYYETPDKGRIDITPVKITNRVLTQRQMNEVPIKKKKDGKPFDLKSDEDECWFCDGWRVYELDVAMKEASVAQLPCDMQGENIMHSPLPFLFGMPPEEAKRRFQMSLPQPIDPKTGRAFLHILPRLPQDAGDWASADVTLDLNTFLPDAVQLVDPAGTKITVYSFESLKVNENEWFDKSFDEQSPRRRFRPDLSGFTINSSDGGQPDQEKPELVNVQGMLHFNAVTKLQRQGLMRIKNNQNKNNIILEAGPAAIREGDVFTVKSQDPPPGTPLQTGMKVRLTIWTEPNGPATQ